MRRVFSLLLTVATILFAACGGQGVATSFVDGDTLTLRYASNLTYVRYDSFCIASLRNPWDTTRTLHTYVLVDRNSPLPAGLPEGTLVRTPLTRAVVYSSVHCSLLHSLGVTDAIGGVCDLKYIKLPVVQNRVKEGNIQDFGEGLNPNIEKMMDVQPDALMPSPFENSGGYGRLANLGIPIIECADYMETSALGRAEWMRFYGRLFGCAAQADSLFASVEQRYNELKALITDVRHRPTLLTDLRFGSSWYMSGGNSTAGRLYADAGADYLFAYLKESGSVPLSFENVLDRAQDADIWLIRYNRPDDMTYADVKEDYAPYAGFRAFQQRNIFGCNTNRIPFYEETPFHPDRLLADLLKIFHPDRLPDHKLRYFCPLK